MFEPLGKEEIKEIVKIQLNLLAKKLEENHIELKYTDEAVDYLSEIGYDPQYGARPVKRVIQKEVLNELSKEMLAQKVKPNSTIVLDVFEGKFVFRKPLKEELQKEKK
jgi:ATP-dependent Clp protease ATP-binding subunit ClpB